MALSYMEDLVALYFRCNGYLVSQNVWFYLPKEKIGKKVSGWTDIDVFALNPVEAAIVQCKSFTGTAKSEKVVKEITAWFKNAEEFVQNDKIFSNLTKGKELRKILVVDFSIKKSSKEIMTNNIEIKSYEEILVRLLQMFKHRRTKNIAERQDPLGRLFISLIDKGFIKEEVLNTVNYKKVL